jgi:hypothetical protein
VTNTTHSGAAKSSSERGSREKDDIPGGAKVSSDGEMLRSSRLPTFTAGVPWQRVGRQGSDRTTKERERERERERESGFWNSGVI